MNSRKMRFSAGDKVRIKALFPPGHVRTPFFTRGASGEVRAIQGSFANPELLAYGKDGQPAQPLYRVAFRQKDLWADYQGADGDDLIADIYEHWLEPEDG